ncbi:EF-hand calcium-binding domain-containing protein 1-like [Crassostrea angulata]|uniref:EF-hand calcium-binding domain-containing protein 1-like n=1 Tax=Magallana angulata TaxID=2784310 RepID=UPI0022B14B27|nr:EF-hand calcium-binding domain-containing protein 1-like [Crassostrea angulata]
MKVSLLLVLIVITWCMIDESEGARRRRRFRRVARRVCGIVCSYKCVRYCSKCAPVCPKVCKRVCGGKRSEVSGSSPLPCNFAAWDKNGDDHVDLEEFSSVAYPNVKEGDLALAFKSTDKDENQQISKSELHKAEIMFGIC